MVILQNNTHNNAMKRLLAKLRLGEVVFCHAISDASRSFSSHLNIAKIPHGIHEMMVSRCTQIVNRSLIYGGHEALMM